MTDFFRPTNQEAQGPQSLPKVTQPWRVGQLNIYITDSCSLSCQGCISFNDFALGGHLMLTDTVRERMAVWAQNVFVEHIYIMGGEPLAHPDIDSYLEFIDQLWPRTPRRTIVTNGVLLAQRTDSVQRWLEQGWDIEVSAHTQAEFDAVTQWWNQLSESMIGSTVPERRKDLYGITDYWVDADGAPLIQIGLRDRFHKPNYRVTEQGTLAWPKLTSRRTTHSLCGAKECHYLVDGVMYRCPVQATLPRLSERYTIEGEAGAIAEQDLGFDPLNPRHSLSLWMDTLNRPTAQCSLCEWPRPLESLGDPHAKKIQLVRRT